MSEMVTFMKTARNLLLFFSLCFTCVSYAKESPKWNLEDIKNSNIEHIKQSTLANTFHFDASVMSSIVIIEFGSRNVTLLNTTTFEPITHFTTRFALHEPPHYSPDGRFAYFIFHNGWISKYDIYTMKMVAEVKAGISSQNLAISNDGAYAIVSNNSPNNVVILDAKNLSPMTIITAKNNEGVNSQISEVYNAPPRYSFVVAFKDIKEVWEIPYSNKGGVDVYKGWAHDYRTDSGEGKIENWKSEDKFPVRRIKTDDYLEDLVFDPSYVNLIGTARTNFSSETINLDIKKKVASIKHVNQLNLGTGITWDFQGKEVFGSPNIKENKIVIFDIENWQTIKEVKIKSSTFVMNSHTKSPYIWIKTYSEQNKEQISIIKKDTIDVIKTLKIPSSNAMSYLEFSKNGQYVLLHMRDKEGMIKIFDAETLEELKQLSIRTI